MKVISTKMSLKPDGTRRRPGIPFELKLKKGQKLPAHLYPAHQKPKEEKEIDTLSELGKAAVNTGRDTKTAVE